MYPYETVTKLTIDSDNVDGFIEGRIYWEDTISFEMVEQPRRGVELVVKNLGYLQAKNHL